MQTTLLSIAIALILAVVAALIGPFVIDWGAYRSILESQATHIIGADVEVNGAIDARLLPSPRVTLHDVAVGSSRERMRAEELDIQFALTPILRGNWQAEQMRLVGPQLTVRVDESGHVQAPAIFATIDPDSLSIDRLQIEGGKLTLAGENGANVTLHGLFFKGRARSLFGPFDGSGAFNLRGESYTIESLSTGRFNEGAIRVRAALQPGEHPYRINGEGTLAFAEGKPRFDGSLTLAPPPGLKRHEPTWHLSGKLTASAGSALLQNLEFVYGSDKQALKLTGLVRLDYAKAPSLTAQLRAPRFDVDQLLAAADGSHSAPAATLRQLVQWSSAAAFLPSMPISVGLQLDEVVLGGGSILEVSGDLKSTDNGWSLKPLEFRAPGFSKVSVWGDLNVGKNGAEFAGPAEIQSGDPTVLFAWLEGRGEIAPSAARPLSLGGKLTLASDKLALDDLKASIGSEPVSGSLAYKFASGTQGATIDAALNAQKLDLDTVVAFGKAMAAGSTMDLPQAVTLKAAIGQASFGGFSGRDAQADLNYDRDGLSIKKLSVADLGGAQLQLGGVLAFGKHQGRLEADLSAPELKPVLAVLARVAPDAAAAFDSTKGSPAKLHAMLSVAPSNAQGRATLKLDGSVAGTQIALQGEGLVDLTSHTLGEMRLDGRIGSANAQELLPLLHLDRVIAVADGPGALTFKLDGKPTGPVTVAAEMNASGLKGKVSGTATFIGPQAANLAIDIAQANAAPLQAGSGRIPLPISYKSAAVLNGGKLSLKTIKADIAGAQLNGDLDFTIGQPLRIAGKLDADAGLSAGAALPLALGSPLLKVGPNGRWVWASEAFAPALIGAVEGDVSLNANTIALLPAIGARRFSATLHFGAQEIAARNILAEVGNGKLKGDLAIADSANGVTVKGYLTLAGADAATLIRSGPRAPLTGTLGMDLSFEGSGLSPVALAGSLRGSGKLTLADVQLAGLNPRAFGAVTRAVDDGLPVETARISDIVDKALDSGALKLRSTEVALAITSGQLRFDQVKATSDDATVSVVGMLDLTDGMIDSQVVLSGGNDGSNARPDIFMSLNGPLAEPQKSIDVSALTGWLTLRAVENQAKKLKSLEEAEAKRRAEEAQRRAAEEEKRREEARRQAEIEARARAEDQAKLRALTDAPPVLAPASASAAASGSSRAPAALPEPKETVTKDESQPHPKAAPTASATSPRQPAPELPPPVTIRRAPAPWGANIH